MLNTPMNEWCSVVSLAPVAAPFTPADFQHIPYTSALLLPSPFAVSIISDVEYHPACEWGFGAYFNGMYQYDDANGSVFLDHFYTRDEVCEELFCLLRSWGQTPLAWSVGFYLGWLSALALTDRQGACDGLSMLVTLLNQLQGNALC